MKITLELPDNTILCAFLNGVRSDGGGSLSMFSYALDTGDLTDGSEIKLPREKADGE